MNCTLKAQEKPVAALFWACLAGIVTKKVNSLLPGD
jgi:hypothetical protein